MQFGRCMKDVGHPLLVAATHVAVWNSLTAEVTIEFLQSADGDYVGSTTEQSLHVVLEVKKIEGGAAKFF